MERKPQFDHYGEKKRLPGIHRLIATGIVLLIFASLAVMQYVVYEIENNNEHNETVLELSKHIEQDAHLVSAYMLPSFQTLHSLDLAVSRHLAEFELFVLDADRDRTLLADSLSVLQSAFFQFPQEAHVASDIDRALLEESVGVLVDITHEALEVQSPNQLLQLLSDSEDVFREYQAQLTDIRSKLDDAVLLLGTAISHDLSRTRQSLAEQQSLLDRLEYTTIGSLALMLLFLLAVSVQLFRLLQYRLGAVADYARAIANGEYTSVIGFTSLDHIGDMAESVDHMGRRMAALVEQAQTKAETATRAQEAALKLTNFDALTDLPNRKYFFAILASAIDEARRLQEKVAVAYLDLDDFKKVNDSFGHSIGDELLRAVAERLRHSVRESDLIARDMGDLPPPKLSRLG